MIRNFIVVMLDYMDYITRDINAYRSDTFHSVKFFALYQFVNLTIRSLFYTNTLRNFQVYIIGARFSSSCYRSRKRSFFYFSSVWNFLLFIVCHNQLRFSHPPKINFQSIQNYPLFNQTYERR